MYFYILAAFLNATAKSLVSITLDLFPIWINWAEDFFYGVFQFACRKGSRGSLHTLKLFSHEQHSDVAYDNVAYDNVVCEMFV